MLHNTKSQKFSYEFVSQNSKTNGLIYPRDCARVALCYYIILDSIHKQAELGIQSKYLPTTKDVHQYEVRW